MIEMVYIEDLNDDLDAYLRENFQVWSLQQIAPADGYVRLLKQICNVICGKLVDLPSARDEVGGVEIGFNKNNGIKLDL